jgi:hypothetical protein
MSNIDKLPAAQTPKHLDADALFGLLVKRADELAGCTEGSAEGKRSANVRSFPA